MSSRWADTSIGEGDAELGNTARCKHAISVFYDLPIDVAPCQAKIGSRSVMERLGLNRDEWPEFLQRCRLVDMCTAGVSMDVLVKSDDHVADVLSCLLYTSPSPRDRG